MNYIPKRNADFASWLANIATIIAASYAAYGVASGDAAALTALNTTYQAAYTEATEPTTRTAGTIATANDARAAAETFVRPICQAIAVDPNITPEQKIAIGVSTRQSMPSPIPAPTVAPSMSIQSAIPGQVTLKQTNPATGKGAKPFGAVALEIATVTGTAHTADPSSAVPRGVFTRPLVRLTLSPEESGLKVSLFARYATRSGPGGQAQVGPWSAPLQFVAM